MKKVLSLLLSFVILLSITAGIDMTALAEETCTLSIEGTYNYTNVNEVLRLVNLERQKMDLPALTLDEELVKAAEIRAAEIAIYFEHTRPDGTECSTVSPKLNRENIAAAYTTPDSVVQGWMDSIGHKDNILSSDSKSIGIACFIDSSNVFYWVQCFSVQESAKVPSISGTAKAKQDIKVSKSCMELYGNFTIDSLNDDYMLIGEKGSIDYGINNKGWEGKECSVSSDNFEIKSSNTAAIRIGDNGEFIAEGEGTATVRVCIKSNPNFCVSKDITVKREDVASDIVTVSGIEEEYAYTGNEIAPKPHLSYKNSIPMTENVDYTLSYSNNTNKGTATLEISGMGKFKGVKTISFKIVDSSPVEHEHEYESKIEKEATCTEEGRKSFTCSVCGETYDETIPKKDHTVVNDPAVEPTCTQPGKTAGTHCSVCGTVLIEQTTVPVKDHTVVNDPAVEPTCTQPGKTAGTHCSVCGTVLIEQTTVPVKDHTVVNDPAVEPTCTQPGKTAGTHCSVCGTVLIEQNTVPAKGHSFSDWELTTPPSCTKEGVETRSCSCGETETRSVAKIAHTPGEWEEIKAANCTEEGERIQKCTVCGTVVSKQTVSALGHTPGEWETVKEPSCTENGLRKSICTVCGEELTEEINALGHTPGEWKTVKESSCTENGLKKSTCAVCGEELTEEISATGHSFGDWEEKDGKKVRTCKLCGFKEVVNSAADSAAQSTNKTADKNKSSKSPSTGANDNMVIEIFSIAFSFGVLLSITFAYMRKRKAD